MLLNKGALAILALCGLCCMVNASGFLKIFQKQSTAKKTINDYSGVDGLYHFYRYEAISLYLEEHLARFEVFYLDLFANIKVARQMYAEYVKSDHPDKEGLLDAIRLFVSIDTINDENSCTQRSYDILWNNYKAANNMPERGYVKELSQRRINLIVAKALLVHEIRCHGKYFDKFDRLLKQVDSSSYDTVQTMVKALVKRDKGDNAEEFYGSAQSMFEFAREYLMLFKVANDLPFVIETLTTLAKDDPNLKDLEPVKHEHFTAVDYNKVDALVTKYLSKPCVPYFNAMQDVFLPAELDAKSKHEVVQEKLAFYQGWTAFQFCDVILADHSQIVYNIKEYKERTGVPQ